MRKSNLTAFLDMLFVLLMVFLLLPHNPKLEESKDTAVPSNLVIEAVWHEEVDADVDLWVQAPGDNSVGYSRRGGKYLDLLRDDLGRVNDVTNLNFELVFGRGAPAGEYTVNVHLYSNRSGIYPIEVDINITIEGQGPFDIGKKKVITERVSLEHYGQEITVIRFTFDPARGKVENLHKIPKSLRTGGNNNDG